MAKKIAAIMFMVRYPSKVGAMMAWSSGGGLTRKEARDKFSARLAKGETWKSSYRKGARVVFVEIKEI